MKLFIKNFTDKFLSTSSVIEFVNEYNKSKEDFIQLRFSKSVEKIDDLLIAYLFLFSKQNPNLNIELNFDEANDAYWAIINQVNFLKTNYYVNISISTENPYEKSTSKVKQSDSFIPLLFIEQGLKDFTKRGFEDDLNQLIWSKIDEVTILNLKNVISNNEEFLKIFKNKFEKENIVSNYLIHLLDELDILRELFIIHTGIRKSNSKNDYRINNLDKINSVELKKGILRELNSDSFKENYSNIFIYLFRVLIAQYRPNFKDLGIEKELFGSEYTSYNYPHVLNKLIKETNELITILKELSKNIVEHSSHKMGVVNVRLFSESFYQSQDNESSDNNSSYQSWYEQIKVDNFKKIVNINVIDLGTEDIISTYIKNIQKQIVENNKLEEILNIDIKELKQMEFKDLYRFDSSKLMHQRRKEMVRIGLLYFANKIIEKKGFFSVCSNNPTRNHSAFCYYNKERAQENSFYVLEELSEIIKIGTYYNFTFPIIDLLAQKNEMVKDKSYNNFGADRGASTSILKHLSKYKVIEENIEIENHKDEKTILEVKNIESIQKESHTKYDELYKICDSITKNNASILLIKSDNYAKHWSASDWMRFLFLLNDRTEQPIIVIGLSYDIYCQIIDITKLLQKINISNNEENENSVGFWHNKKNLLFYVKFQIHNDNNRYNYVWFNSLFSGNTFDEYCDLNKSISHYHFNTFLLTTEDHHEKKEEIDFNNDLFSDNKLLNFELIIENRGKTLFEDSIKSLLYKPIEDTYGQSNPFLKTLQGYKIANKHFKLGSNLHIETFYYAKRLFYNSFYANRFAFIISKYIYETQLLKKYNEVTILGYGVYSELLVSNIRRLLNEKGNNEINHDVILENGKILRNANDLKGNVLVVIPISSTFSTSLKIQKQVEKIYSNKNDNRNKISFIEPFINIIEVANVDLDIVKWEDDLDSKTYENSFYESFGWTTSDEPKTIQINEKRNEDVSNKLSKQKYFIAVQSKWQEIFNCEFCYPQDKKDNYNKEEVVERCLLETEKNNVTPDIIFDMPRVLESKTNNKNLFDLLVYKDNDNSKIHIINNHIRKNKKDYIFYIKSADFLKYNNLKEEEKVKNWLKNISIEELSKNKAILITPSELSNSGFVDLINEVLFQDTATVFKYSAKDDSFQNFEKFHTELLKNGTIYFVDDVISTGAPFWDISAVLENLGCKISYCFSLINRMNFYNETKLNNYFESENYFYFLKINIPSIIDKEEKEYFLKKIKVNKQLSKYSLLDSMRTHFYNEYNRLIPIDLSKERMNNHEENQNVKALFNTLLYHYIYSYFISNNSRESFTIYSILRFIGKQGDIKKFIENYPDYKNEININIIRILSEPPFNRYIKIKTEGFDIVLKRLQKKNFIAKLLNTPNGNRSIFTPYMTFKLWMRIAVNLKINYLFSIDFLFKIKQILESELENEHALCTYYAAMIQELIYEDEAKAVQLIKNIVEILKGNDSRFNYKSNNIDLKNNFNDPFINLLKILVLENNFIFGRFFKYFFKEQTPSIKFRNESFPEFKIDFDNYYESYRTSALDRMVGRFSDKNGDDRISFDKVDDKIKEAFVKTAFVKKIIYDECNDDNISNSTFITLTKKLETLLDNLCDIMNIKEGGAYLTIRLKGLDRPNDTDIEADDLFVVSQFSNEKKYSLSDYELVSNDSIVLKVFQGIKEEDAKKPKTGFELLKEGTSWKMRDMRNISEDFVKNDALETNGNIVFNNYYFLRISDINFGLAKNNLEENNTKSVAVITFYDNSQKLNENPILFDPKRIRFLLMLRDDIRQFIKKHLESGSMLKWAEDESKNKNRKRLSHGINHYLKAFKKYNEHLTELINGNETNLKQKKAEILTNIKYVELLTRHLSHKIEFIEDEIEINNKTAREILFDELEIEIKSFLTLEIQKSFEFDIKSIQVTKIDNFHIYYNFNIWKSVIFEILFNIRKYIIPNIQSSIKKNGLKIELSADIDYFNLKIKYYKIFDLELENKKFNKAMKSNKPKGLAMINKAYQDLKLKNQFVQFVHFEKNEIYLTIKIPLK